MINIGIDFGSTYTMVSTVSDSGAPEIVGSGVNSYNHPTIVVYDKAKDKYYFGAAAKSRQSNANCVIFRGFKMLLNQQMSAENLRKRGYDDKNTPEYITELFLKYIIDNALSKTGEDKIGSLILGAPECWFQSIDNVDARGTLRDICMKIDSIEDKERIRIVSEPTNAAAFCVWNYKNDGFGDLTGNVLVIDYGGGTLDTALVSIGEFDGNMTIKPQLRAGAGENHDNEIGKGGIAYQEALARTAICEALGIDESGFGYDADFYKLLKALEENLISIGDEIEEIFDEYNLTPDLLDDETFGEFDYKGNTVEINYGQMYRTYQKVIAPVLKQVLDETAAELSYDDHIALVGGFNNFCLVKKQIYDYFKIGTKDSRTNGMIKKESEREQAIAHGAALFADEVITLCDVAPFSIGTYARFPDGSLCRQFAINYGQEIEYDKVYFALDEGGNPYPMFAANIDTFLLNFTKSEENAIPMQPKLVFIKKLNSIKHGPCIVMGFSMDHADRITVHIYNYSLEKRRVDEKPVGSIKLSTLKDTFENTIITGGLV